MEDRQDEKIKQTEEWIWKFLELVEKLPKEERWNWLKKQSEYDEFCNKILEEIYGKDMVEDYREDDSSKNDGMASLEKKYYQKIDNIVFMEALQEFVCEYKKSDEIAVFQKFRKKLKQKYHYELTKEQLSNELMGIGFKNKKKLINAYAAYQKYKKKMGYNFKDMESLHEAFRVSMEGKYPRKIIEEVIDICDNNFGFREDLMQKEENEQDPFDNIIDSSEREDYKMPEVDLLEKERKKDIEKDLDFLVEAYEVQAKGLSVKEREFTRVFFTRTILKCLKLKAGKDPDGKEETKCKGYHRFAALPAGVEEIYLLLKRQESFYMNTTFHMDYIGKAVEKEPEKLDTLYGIYYNLLEKEFKFTDDVIVETLGENKQNVSRYQKKYKEFTKRLWQMKEGLE